MVGPSLSEGGVVVCKFGGSSLADASMMRRVREIIEADPRRRYIVPSAPGKRHAQDRKITDLLYLCHEHAKQGLPLDSVFELIEARYLEIASSLEIQSDVKQMLSEVKQGIVRTSTPTPDDSKQDVGGDFAASRGEYLNARILAEFLGYDFIDASDVVFFDARGRLDEAKTYDAVSKRLSQSERAVVPGFYGSSPTGEVKTFSRGGSDISGAIIARGVEAQVYENWTDVSGLLMADPNVVSQPRVMKVVTYRELRELSYMGAKVLHDEAVFPVRSAGIPVNIRSTLVPTDEGTWILPDDVEMSADQPVISGVAGRKDFTVIAIEKAMMNSEVGFARRMLSVLERFDVSFEHLPSGIDTMSVVVEDAAVDGQLDAILDAIKLACQPDSIDVDPDMALIATVGRGMNQKRGTASKLFNALSESGVNIRMIDQGSSEMNIIVGVNTAEFDQAVNAIYQAFVT